MALDITSYAMGKKKGGVTPTGEIDITQNGITNVSGYATANVQVPQPSGKITITQNGTDIDVSSYASADVNVSGSKVSISGTSMYQYFINWGYPFQPPEIEDTSNITNFSYAYVFNRGTPQLTTIDNIKNFDVSSGTNFASMFSGFASLTSLDFSNWIFSPNAYYFDSMFVACTHLLSVDLSNLGGVKNGTTSFMFRNCSNLKTVDLSNLESTGTTFNCQAMFSNCTSLEQIDMSKFDFTTIGNYAGMFGSNSSDGPANDCLIYVKDQTQVDWFTTNFSRLTNVQIKGA